MPAMEMYELDMGRRESFVLEAADFPRRVSKFSVDPNHHSGCRHMKIAKAHPFGVVLDAKPPSGVPNIEDRPCVPLSGCRRMQTTHLCALLAQARMHINDNLGTSPVLAVDAFRHFEALWKPLGVERATVAYVLTSAIAEFASRGTATDY